MLLMDAPPPEKPVSIFAEIANFLLSNGLYAPKIEHIDQQHGLMLLEDFGNDTFTRILAREPARETELYELATDTLIKLHQIDSYASIDLPLYNTTALMDEVRLLTEWFYPALTGEPANRRQQESYESAWQKSFAALAPHRAVLVLRDYHVDNLMELTDADGEMHCGLLDFQDALMGSPAYDLISLIEDARRNISAQLKEHCLQRYLSATEMLQDFPSRTELTPWLNVLAAQRHAKVLGIFVRLYKRDKKANYLEHLPRVLALYEAALKREPLLNPVSSWMSENLPFTDIRLSKI